LDRRIFFTGSEYFQVKEIEVIEIMDWMELSLKLDLSEFSTENSWKDSRFPFQKTKWDVRDRHTIDSNKEWSKIRCFLSNIWSKNSLDWSSSTNILCNRSKFFTSRERSVCYPWPWSISIIDSCRMHYQFAIRVGDRYKLPIQ
jgi:hypothetical protein